MIWVQREVRLAPRPRGFHLVTREVLDAVPELGEIEVGVAARGDNLLSHAPHTLEQVIADDWSRPYPRERAAFPSLSTRLHKVWPTVGRIDSAYGDRNLMCTCPPVESYAS